MFSKRGYPDRFKDLDKSAEGPLLETADRLFQRLSVTFDEQIYRRLPRVAFINLSRSIANEKGYAGPPSGRCSYRSCGYFVRVRETPVDIQRDSAFSCRCPIDGDILLWTI
ncbi:hypothetical protein PgNI_10925 [Pyricularia grisea]|uniref:Uncharacterized protein n=1 Tax=Pyricularia grisea TaxID=148305 RepID=A0A6P8AXN4_PYRGI|nr:hypothetical protein PgNI_10925 [Pyricularia grisea]TLD07049.1 hypothetical protein PgNI_10925 [Pyricularia grisea]